MISLYQPGTLVNWTPSTPEMVEAMLRLAKLTPRDVLIDLGSGDGRIVIAAAKRGCMAHGYEDNLELLSLSRENARIAGVEDRTKFYLGDFRDVDLNYATVITMFIDRPAHKLLLKKLANLKPGVRLISNTFHLWEHDAEITVKDDPEFHTARLWVAP
jgi:tRNA/tmRNA/rRNA uracil-C5-methylase (TrmA/RlmC/RlmD family)